jgi:hypothetical protein
VTPPVISSIAAFPWVYCNEPIEIGSVRLLPYVRGKLPGDLPHAKQADLDAILAAYADLANHVVARATLLELGDWHTGMHAGDHVNELFWARELIAFAALAKRRLFRQHFDYCNAHTYSLIVQRYEPGKADRFVFSSRRRDGSVRHMWVSDQFAHLRPNHVSSSSPCDLDRPLLAALLQLSRESPLREAIREFNSANTDSDDVPVHVEVVMVKSAFEWLLGINTGVQEFVEGLNLLLSPILAAPPVDGPMAERWRKRWGAVRPLEAWARDFCDVRGAAAHGERSQAPRFVWPAHAHLAFAAIFFPLVLKKRLADESFLTLSEADAELLRHIEQLLMVDPFSGESLRRGQDNEHPWAEIHYEALWNNLARRLWKESDVG